MKIHRSIPYVNKFVKHFGKCYIQKIYNSMIFMHLIYVVTYCLLQYSLFVVLIIVHSKHLYPTYFLIQTRSVSEQTMITKSGTINIILVYYAIYCGDCCGTFVPGSKQYKLNKQMIHINPDTLNFYLSIFYYQHSQKV